MPSLCAHRRRHVWTCRQGLRQASTQSVLWFRVSTRFGRVKYNVETWRWFFASSLFGASDPTARRTASPLRPRRQLRHEGQMVASTRRSTARPTSPLEADMTRSWSTRIAATSDPFVERPGTNAKPVIGDQVVERRVRQLVSILHEPLVVPSLSCTLVALLARPPTRGHRIETILADRR